MSRRAGIAALALASAALLSASSAAAATPAWSIESVAVPTHFKPKSTNDNEHYYEVVFEDIGGAPTDGSPIEITDTLPAGLSVKSTELKLPVTVGEEDFGPGICKKAQVGQTQTVTCKIEEGAVALEGAVEPAIIWPSEAVALIVNVAIPKLSELPSAALGNEASVKGGGGVEATTSSVNEASSAPAPAGLAEFRSELTDEDGQPVGEAGSHPYRWATAFAVNTAPTPPGSSAPRAPAEGNVKDIEVALPPGFVGSETALKPCTIQQFNTIHGKNVGSASLFENECPDASAVGLVVPQQLEGQSEIFPAPLYLLEPPKGTAALLGFDVDGEPVYIEASLDTEGGYELVGHVLDTPEALRISAARVTIWGNPADESHDRLRGSCTGVGRPFSVDICPANIPPEEQKAFLRLPTSCEDPLLWTMSFNLWEHPGTVASGDSVEPAPIGCELPPFVPSIEAKPDTALADSPSGLHFDLHNPQSQDPKAVGEADLRDARIAFPKGLLVNPASAGGLGACSPAQIGLLSPLGQLPARFSASAPQCPNASKLGTVEVDTPLLDHPLPGAIYLAQQSQNPFGSLIAVYVTVDDPQSGVVVKLPGEVTPDPLTGQLSTTVAESPQTPFEHFKVDLFGGPRGALRTPAACGEYQTSTNLKPWTAPASGPDATPTDSFQISGGPAGPCPSGALSPKLSAGLANPKAATYSPFSLRLTREDASEEFSSVTATTPPGFAARLAGVPYCPAAGIAQAIAREKPGDGALELTSPSCPAASQVGAATAGAGAGPLPFFTAGKVYLAGPYKGAPLSFVAIVPAVAGPFDLGVVVNRIALHIDPETVKVSAQSDPFPRILAGIPLDVRDIRVNVDRPEFTLAPTNCQPKSVDATVQGVSGDSATASERFQVGGCKALGFKPSLSLRLKGGTKRSQHPALRATLTYPKGAYANTAKAVVALPHSEFLEQAHIKTICTRVQFAAGACPKGSIYGKARATSPLLAEPLSGPVYLRSSSHPLPDLVIALHGQIDVDAVGRIDSHNSGIRTSFEGVPDAPISKFVLEMQGGAKGLLVNSQDLCRHTNRADASFTGQNGKTYSFRPVLKSSCKGGGKKARLSGGGEGCGV